MVVGGSQQETLDPGFVLHGTHQQDVPVILRELVLPVGFDLVSPSFTVRNGTTELSEPPGFVLLGTRQQGVTVIVRELVLPGGFDHVSSSFTVSCRLPPTTI
ncbi:unnamed protein product [Schistosoma margrebowiei]|uniref:Uncharacterized protein n=1 Tax=Schistosoma margrebowiei TaxID=48269 RepID=A0A183LBG6_9TREM|nr:unnamed protein product [Schistosoma margrebowiei]